MKLKQTSTDQPAQPSFGGYWRNADYVTSLRSRAYIEASAGVAALVLGGWASLEIASALPMIPAIYVASVMGLRAVVRWRRANDVMRVLWDEEVKTNSDIDGNGVVGPPRRRTRYINIAGEHVAFAEEEEDDADVIELVPGFELSPDDLAALVQHAAAVGLARDKLMGFQMPSGQRVSKSTWERWTDEAARRGWIAKGGSGYASTWQRTPAAIIQALQMTRPAGQSGSRPGDVTASDRPPTAAKAGEGRR